MDWSDLENEIIPEVLPKEDDPPSTNVAVVENVQEENKQPELETTQHQLAAEQPSSSKKKSKSQKDKEEKGKEKDENKGKEKKEHASNKENKEEHSKPKKKKFSITHSTSSSTSSEEDPTISKKKEKEKKRKSKRISKEELRKASASGEEQPPQEEDETNEESAKHSTTSLKDSMDEMGDEKSTQKKRKVSKYFNSLITPKKESSGKESAYRTIRNKIVPSYSLSSRTYRSKTCSLDPNDPATLSNSPHAPRTGNSTTDDINLKNSSEIRRKERNKSFSETKAPIIHRDCSVDSISEMSRSMELEFGFSNSLSIEDLRDANNSNSNLKLKRSISQIRAGLFLPGQTRKVVPKVNLTLQDKTPRGNDSQSSDIIKISGELQQPSSPTDNNNMSSGNQPRDQSITTSSSSDSLQGLSPSSSSPSTSAVIDTIDIALYPSLRGSTYPSFLDLSPLSFNIKADEFLSSLNDVYKIINLSNNNFTKLENISHFHKLKILNVDNNHLSTIKLSGLTNLQYLSLDNNFLLQIPSLDDLSNLLFFSLRGNKISGGFEEIRKLEKVKVLDLSNCSIDISLEEFKAELLPILVDLKSLEYFSFAENQILLKYPEIKYIIISKLPKLKMYDYQEITPELREIAPSVVDKGIQILHQRNKREELRLAAEQDNYSGSPKNSSNNIVVVEKYFFDLSKLPHSITSRIFSYLQNDDLYSCSHVCKYWRKAATDLREYRNSKILRSYSVLLPHSMPCCQSTHLNLSNIISQIQPLPSFSQSVFPVNNYDEEILLREKFVLIFLSKHTANDVWSQFYDQLTHRLFCTPLQPLPYRYIRYSIFEIEKDTMATGIDLLMRRLGAIKILPNSPFNSNIPLEERITEWLKLLPERLKSEFTLSYSS